MKLTICLLLSLPCLMWSAEHKLNFNQDIRPILSENCFSCHGPAAKEAKGKLQLHTLAAATAPLGKAKDRQAIVPGKRSQSEVWARINTTDKDDRMPPLDSHHELKPAEIARIGQWIDEGAVYEGHWAFQPIAHTTVAGATIDTFIKAKLTDVGLKLSPSADKLTLLRRLSQDLTGLPPTSAQIAAWNADASVNAYEQLVDQLLASPATAERLTVDWLDGARYADTNGYSIDDHRDMWVWRDWVINAFQTNQPFNQFIVEQIAGDLLPQATEQQKVATGFLRNSMNTHEGGTIPEEYRVTYTADKVDTVATVFMGLTMKCAQCHDHKYDPLSQKEYYQFFAFFNSTTEPGEGATNANTGPLIEAGSAICSVERVQSDVAHRMSELQRLHNQPPTALAAARDAWEAATLPTLTPPKPDELPVAEAHAKPAKSALTLFAKEPPKWIWAAKDKTAESVEFRRVFTVDALPAETLLWWSCDDAATVVLNDKKIGETTNWQEPKSFPVVVQKGRNVFTVHGTNGAGSPAGLLLSLAMRGTDGKMTYVATDIQWEAKIAGTEEWQAAAVIGKHGDDPWGVLYDEKSTKHVVAKATPLYPLLSTAPAKRTAQQWRAINDEFAKKDAAFKIFISQLNLEEKVLKKTAETGRSTVMVMNYKPRATFILNRGAYDQPGEAVTEGVPAVLPPLSETAAGAARNRLDLAQWLVNPTHPLTARVIVNRYWQMLFGMGLVKTAENFGSQGDYPSHPQLIDWLATDFVANGWNLRRMLKLLVMSEVYRQSSVTTPALLETDPYNRLLARAPRFRLSAESVRDSALLAGGLLLSDLGGPSVFPYQPDGLWEGISHYGYPQGFTAQKYLPGTGRGLYRRSMYTVWKRTLAPPSMAIFDAPSRETCTVRRTSTNTPLQALVLENDPQFLEAARALGVLMRRAGSVELGIATGVERVLGRKPTKLEAELLAKALKRYQATYKTKRADAEALLSIGELSTADGDSADNAAWTLVASTLLNMDEAVTRQ